MNLELFQQSVGGFFLLVALFLISWYCQRKAYERGQKCGYRRGWEAAENWIVKLETEVDQARQEIWRGEKP